MSPLTAETFELDKLSEPARQQAMNIHLVDQEIRHLQFQLAPCHGHDCDHRDQQCCRASEFVSNLIGAR